MTAFKKYTTVAKLSFQEYLIYRGNLYIEVSGELFTTLALMGLWYALYTATGAATVGDYSLEQMLTYLLGVGFVSGTLHILGQGDRQMSDINQGTLNNYLLKPFSPVLYWLVNDLSRKAMMFLYMAASALVAGVIFLPLLNLSTITVPSTLFFFTALALAAVLHFALFHFVVLATFWTGLSWGLTFVIRVLMIIAAGGFIPLELLPGWVAPWFLHSPLRHFGYTQIQLLLGNMYGTEALLALVSITTWTVGIFVAARVVYRFGLKAYGAYGG